MRDPIARRPHMPGYGIEPASEPGDLLPWSWAEDRIRATTEYWLTTTTPDGGPHVMPVWGTWLDGALWFSSGLSSRKARNLAADPRCAVAAGTGHQPVVIEGRVERVTDLARIAAFAAAIDDKYGTDYGAAFYEPATVGTFRLAADRIFGLDDAAFTTSPTRWTPAG